jgi:hypothetical protein
LRYPESGKSFVETDVSWHDREIDYTARARIIVPARKKQAGQDVSATTTTRRRLAETGGLTRPPLQRNTKSPA